MKLITKSFPILFLGITLYGCQNTAKTSVDLTTTTTTTNQASSTTVIDDNRPKEELNFLNKAGAEYEDYDSNAAQKDKRVADFNKYATDSLKKIAGWEMIVSEVNDENFSSNSFAKAFFDLDNNPVYNLELVEPIKYDKSVDTIGINNRVEFTYTLPKTPKGDSLKKQLALIQNLKKGDTVIVSGALTHIDDNLKVNFAAVFDKGMPWQVDLLATSVRKK